MTAAKTLSYLGILREPISLAGGFDGWKKAGLAYTEAGVTY